MTDTKDPNEYITTEQALIEVLGYRPSDEEIEWMDEIVAQMWRDETGTEPRTEIVWD